MLQSSTILEFREHVLLQHEDIMEAFVISIFDNEKSVKAAKRCIRTGDINGIAVKPFKATTPKEPIYQMLEKRGIQTPQGFSELYSRRYNAIAAFLSHMRLWEYSFENEKEILILEHDAVFQRGLPKFLNYKSCLQIGQPSYGRFSLPTTMGVQPLVQKDYMKGAHSYIIKPEAAYAFIETAKSKACPTDLFLNIKWFPFIEELYPWVCEAQDTFSTIQNENGCLAKHRYGPKYEILDV